MVPLEFHTSSSAMARNCPDELLVCRGAVLTSGSVGLCATLAFVEFLLAPLVAFAEGAEGAAAREVFGSAAAEVDGCEGDGDDAYGCADSNEHSGSGGGGGEGDWGSG